MFYMLICFRVFFYYFQFIRFRVRALARDYDITRKMSEAKVIVEVQDVNDNSPVFGQKDYKISVLESAKPSKIVLNVKATDMDSSNTEQEIKRGYGEVRYSLTGENANLFEIDPVLGNIQVKNFQSNNIALRANYLSTKERDTKGMK